MGCWGAPRGSAYLQQGVGEPVLIDLWGQEEQEVTGGGTGRAPMGAGCPHPAHPLGKGKGDAWGRCRAGAAS